MKTIDEYIASFPPNTRKLLKAIRATIRKAAPKAEESISYGIAGYKLDGRPLIYFAAHKAHIGLYPMTGGIQEKFKKELAKYDGSKGTVRFPLDEPIPHGLISRIVKFRAQDVAAKKSKGR